MGFKHKKSKNNELINIQGAWRDELLWCPSQCYLNITYKSRQFVVYLRWRHNDPWTAELVECVPNGDFEMIKDNPFEWLKLQVKEWGQDDDLKLIKCDAIEMVKSIIKPLQTTIKQNKKQ